jgi:hypothetical protein
MKLTILLTTILLTIAPAEAKIHRSAAAVARFKRANPCPKTKKTTGRCPDYVVDHIIPLCYGGVDDPSNMQWQPKEESLKKDELERKMCRSKKQ